MACTDRRSDLGRRDPRPVGAQRLSDRTEGRIDAQTRNEIDGDRDFRLSMQTCVAALRLPGRMSVEQVAGCWWAGWPDGVECATQLGILLRTSSVNSPWWSPTSRSLDAQRHLVGALPRCPIL